MVIKKLGFFLFVVGGLVLIVFIGSVMVDNSQYGLLLIASILMAWGGYWMRKGTKTPESSNRFSLIRRFNRKDQNPQDKG